MADELFLIDGNSLAYRAFFALPESIATSTGVPTNAIFGFASMLVKIVTEYGVQPTVVAWDAGTSGRTEMFAEYKAQRRSRPDLLKQQGLGGARVGGRGRELVHVDQVIPDPGGDIGIGVSHRVQGRVGRPHGPVGGVGEFLVRRRILPERSAEIAERVRRTARAGEAGDGDRLL